MIPMSTLLLVLSAAGGSTAPPATATPTATCVFTNPAFSGKCTQNANLGQGGSPQQACESILRCLNDTACLKTYCEATTIRSGWRLESAR